MNCFKNWREFYKKYPSKLYKCFRCNKITPNKYICTQCGMQANNLFEFGFKYKIIESKFIEIIFPPIEIDT